MGTVTKPEGRATPWNKGKPLGQKPPMKLKAIWAIRTRLQLSHRNRGLALSRHRQQVARMRSSRASRTRCGHHRHDFDIARHCSACVTQRTTTGTWAFKCEGELPVGAPTRSLGTCITTKDAFWRCSGQANAGGIILQQELQGQATNSFGFARATSCITRRAMVHLAGSSRSTM
jgi:hypothetical protein